MLLFIPYVYIVVLLSFFTDRLLSLEKIIEGVSKVNLCWTDKSVLHYDFNKKSYWNLGHHDLQTFPSQEILGWFSKRTGTSHDDGTRSTNTRIWSNQNRFRLFRAPLLQSSSDVPALLLTDQPNIFSWIENLGPWHRRPLFAESVNVWVRLGRD